MTLVAVSQRGDIWSDRQETRDALDRRLTRWLADAGYLAAPVPNGLPPAHLSAWLGSVAPAALLLSGGNDLGEDGERDSCETQLLDYARTHHLPVLGLCRGLLMIGSYLGGRLIRVDGHVRCRHRLITTDPGWPESVNSYHNWALAACPAEVEILAHSPDDGMIEAIRHRSLPWEGWMWHPEREAPDFVPADHRRLQILFGRKGS